jgi:hypothetical protein
MNDNELFPGIAFCPQVSELRERFFTDANAPHNMTLEEVMMLLHNRHCRRINPRSSAAKKFQRGSKLIKQREVILILEREDNTLEFPCSSARYSGPRGKQYAGILPGSVIYTKGGARVTVEEAEMVARLRNVQRECVGTFPKSDAEDSLEDTRGGFAGLRCSEYSKLAAYKQIVSESREVLQ